MSVISNFPDRGVAEINKVLEIGRQKGYAPASWRKEHWAHHLGKTIGHLGKLVANLLQGGIGITDEDHWAHALCRLAMALEVFRYGRSATEPARFISPFDK